MMETTGAGTPGADQDEPPGSPGEKSRGPPTMFDLTKCDGPACPQCGCTDSRIITPARGGVAHGVAICGFCGRRFSFTVPTETAGSPADDQQAQADDQARRRRKRS